MIDRTTGVPVYLQIRQQLLERIAGMCAGDRLPNERDLAEEFGVSRMTMSKVFSDLQRQGIIVRYRGRGSFVQRSEGQIHSDSSGRKRVLLLYPDSFSYSVHSLVEAGERLAQSRQIDLVHVKTGRVEWCDHVLQLAGSADLTGMILLPPGSSFEAEDVRRLDALDIPIVGIAFSELALLRKNFYSLSNNDFSTGYRAASHLLETGHRRIGFAPNEPWNEGTTALAKGMEQACSEVGGASLVLPRERVKPLMDSAEAGYQMTRELLQLNVRPTGLIIQSFPGALKGMRAAAQCGLQLPQDLSLISMSGHSGFEACVYPALTTIESDKREFMVRAFGILTADSLERVEKMQRLETHLVDRESVTAPGVGISSRPSMPRLP